MREPGLFFRSHKPPVILDEVQYITGLFPYIKMECGKTEEKGKFLLTGSRYGLSFLCDVLPWKR